MDLTDQFKDRIQRWDTAGLAERMGVDVEDVESWKQAELEPTQQLVETFLYDVDGFYKREEDG